MRNLDRYKRNIDKIYGTTPLSKKPDLNKPLDKVPETPPPRPEWWPFKTKEEWIEAVAKDSQEREVILDNEKIRKGSIPIWYRIRTLLTVKNSVIAAMIGGAVWGIVKLNGCG